MNAPGTKSAWKLLIAVSIVCGVAVFAAGFLHRQAVVDAVAKQQVRSAAVAKAMTNDVAGVNLTKQAKGADEKSLERSVDPPAGTDLVIFSLDGERVYATAGARAVAGDRDQVLDAAKGNVTRVVDGDDLVVYSAIPSEKKGNVAVAAVVTDYEKLLEDASGPLDGARMPLTALGMLLFVAGLVMFVRERKGGGPKAAVAPNTAKAEKVSKMPTFGKSKSAKVAKEPKASKADKAPAKGRVSGFDPVPVTTGPAVVAGPAAAAPVPSAPLVAHEAPPVEAAAPEASKPGAKRFSLGRKKNTDVSEEAPSVEPGKKRALFGRKSQGSVPEAPDTTLVDATAGSANDALEREVAIRQALEDQLELLRTRLQTQEEQSASAIRELREQLETVEAGAASSTVGPAEQDMIQRLATMEADLTQARQAAAEATAQAASMQQELAAAASTTVAADAAEMETQLRALTQQLEEAQRSASESEQRAQSIESVRGELEVRVAQLGSKAGELEQKAEQLEARLREANEGGDAVRAEIASLTAALAAAEARAAELESVASARTDAEAEIARLRGELGKQMERAQVAEERIATLEADVLAAEAGVEELADVAEAEELAAVAEPEPHAAITEPDPEPTEPAVVEQERAAIASPFARLAEHDEHASASEVHDADPVGGQKSTEESVEAETEPEQASGEFASAIVAVPQPASVEARSVVATSRIEVATEPEPEVPEAPHAEVAEEIEPEVVVDAQVEAATEPEMEVVVTSEHQAEAATVEQEAELQIEAAMEPESVVEVFAAGPETQEESDVEPVTDEHEAVATPREPEPEVQPAIEPEPEVQPAIEPEPEVQAAIEPEPEVQAAIEPEPEVQAAIEPEPEVQAGPELEPVQEWRPSEPDGESQQQQAAIPPAPSDADRYDDVWAAAFPVEQQNGSHEVTASEEDIPTAQAEPQTEPDPTTQPQAQHEPPPVASSLDDEPSEPEDGISVEDDLWALRARLAHAGDADQPRQTPPAPSMT